MGTPSKYVLQKKRGRPATGHDASTSIRLSADQRVRIDAWAATQPDSPPRSTAIRRLIDLGLSRSPKRGRLSHAARAQASAMAAEVVDQLNDASAPEEERQKRKRKLIHGPREFREMRQDQHRKDAPGGKVKR